MDIEKLKRSAKWKNGKYALMPLGRGGFALLFNKYTRAAMLTPEDGTEVIEAAGLVKSEGVYKHPDAVRASIKALGREVEVLASCLEEAKARLAAARAALEGGRDGSAA
jgi:hypothetical protein